MVRNIGYLLTLFFILSVFPSRVLAHAFPVRSEPRVGWTISSSPPKVRIWFDSELEPAFSTIAVYDSEKQRMDKGNGRVSPSDPTLLEVELPPLPPGKYRVYWSAVEKGAHHRTKGDFFFAIEEHAP